MNQSSNDKLQQAAAQFGIVLTSLIEEKYRGGLYITRAQCSGNVDRTTFDQFATWMFNHHKFLAHQSLPLIGSTNTTILIQDVSSVINNIGHEHLRKLVSDGSNETLPISSERLRNYTLTLGKHYLICPIIGTELNVPPDRSLIPTQPFTSYRVPFAAFVVDDRYRNWLKVMTPDTIGWILREDLIEMIFEIAEDEIATDDN